MNKKLTVNMLTKIAILAALAVVLRRYFTITIPVNKKIGIGDAPIMISGIIYGPILGGITGALADIVGMLLSPDGVFHPGFTFTAFLTGFLPGVISYYVFRRDYDKKLIWIIVISAIVVFLGVKLFLDSVWLQQYSKNPYWIYVLRRIPKQIIDTIINVLVLSILIPRIKNYA
ncbi:folate family ECF transporter S component [Anaerococcus urinomassiliensis]|uniref:folate family ECF transporter S component n=1 Tax=Anaerococcus urinomassiliensis TaxID=1745712 RepID=UPI00093B2E42|nr:folate family ECF transporter S component [Anaerococcus urinomassiliensis]